MERVKKYRLDVRGEQGDDLRKRLQKVLDEFPYTIVGAAKDMGINYLTLVRFMDGSHATFRKSLWAIRGWVEEKERM